MNQIMLGRPMSIYGSGLQTRAFSYISDVAPVIARTVERPQCFGEIINVGADQPYTILEMATEVARAMGVEPNIKHLEARKEVEHAYTSHDKAKAIFGDLMKGAQLRDGLKEMAAWCKSVGGREPSKYGSYEIEQGLYDFWKLEKPAEEKSVIIAEAA